MNTAMNTFTVPTECRMEPDIHCICYSLTIKIVTTEGFFQSVLLIVNIKDASKGMIEQTNKKKLNNYIFFSISYY